MSSLSNPASLSTTEISQIDLVQARQLALLITKGIALLETQAQAQPPGDAEDEATRDKLTSHAVLTITSAATQLTTLVRPPAQVLFDLATGYALCSALRLVVEANVPEIIRALTLRKSKSKSNSSSDKDKAEKETEILSQTEAGNKDESEGEDGESEGEEEGISVSDIAHLAGVDATKLERILRLLATHHIFVECPPSSPRPTSGIGTKSNPRLHIRSSEENVEEETETKERGAGVGAGSETKEEVGAKKETEIEIESNSRSLPRSCSRFANNRLSCAIDSGAELDDILDLDPGALRAYLHSHSHGGDGQSVDTRVMKKREQDSSADSDTDLEESRKRRWAAKYGAGAPGAGLAALIALQADESMFNATALTDVLLYPRPKLPPPSTSLTSPPDAKAKSIPTLGPATTASESKQDEKHHHQDQSVEHEAGFEDRAGNEDKAADEDAFSRAHGLPRLTMYEWLNLPENAHRLHRFGCAMCGISSLMPEEAVLCGFDFSSLPPESIIVDVGGGVGSTSLPILRAYPHLRLVIQDVEEVVENGRGFWEKHFPSALRSKRVSFQVQDFFDEQQWQQASSHLPSSADNDTSEQKQEQERRRPPAIFLLRMIMHNWPDAQCVKILARLRATAAVPGPDEAECGTRLVIVDSVLMRACRERSGGRADKDAGENAASLMDVDMDVDVVGREEKRGGAKNKEVEEVPEPLLANWGVANGLAYRLDLVMLANHNGIERTLTHFSALLAQAGWKIIEVHAASESWMPQIVAIPTEVPPEFPFPLKSESKMSVPVPVRDGSGTEGGVGNWSESGGSRKRTAEKAGMEVERKTNVGNVETPSTLVGSPMTPRLGEKSRKAK